MAKRLAAWLALVCAATAALGPARAAPQAAPVQAAVLGQWLTADAKGVIRIAPCGTAICGTIAGVSEFTPDGQGPKGADGKPTCERVIIKDMRPGNDGKLHGTVTDPSDDKIYTAQMSIGDSGELRLRGYIGIPMLGRTETWTRVKASISKDCRFTTG